jgi:DNA-binding NarL/FixJ family response regulator
VTTANHDSNAHATDALSQLGASLAARPYARRGVPVSEATIRVVLVDDHALVREGLRLLLQTAPDISVIGEAENGAAGLALAKRVLPDVVVLDLDMPSSDGSSSLRELQKVLPSARVLILTMHAEDNRLVFLLESGARGYLTKEAASRDLVEAIRAVAAGEVYVRPTVARLLAAAVVPKHAAETARTRFEMLSDRERTVLRLVAQGYSGAEIARQLGVSTKTVDAYKRRVHEKLGLQHRTDYVRFAIEAEILGS